MAYLVFLKQSLAGRQVLADVLRFDEADFLDEPRLFLLSVLKELEEHSGLFQSGLTIRRLCASPVKQRGENT